MCATRAKISGSLSRTQSNLVSVKFGSAGLQVSSMRCSRPSVWCSQSHCGALRVSHQMSEGRKTLPAASSSTAPCICPVNPIPAIALAGWPLAVSTARMACCAARHQSAGSCSAQPSDVARKGACSLAAEATTLPFASTNTARVPPVPISIPKKNVERSPCMTFLNLLDLNDSIPSTGRHSSGH